jgi:hypothetical protein
MPRMQEAGITKSNNMPGNKVTGLLLEAISKFNLVNLSYSYKFNFVFYRISSLARFFRLRRGVQPEMHEPPRYSLKYLKLTQISFFRCLLERPDFNERCLKGFLGHSSHLPQVSSFFFTHCSIARLSQVPQ